MEVDLHKILLMVRDNPGIEMKFEYDGINDGLKIRTINYDSLVQRVVTLSEELMSQMRGTQQITTLIEDMFKEVEHAMFGEGLDD